MGKIVEPMDGIDWKKVDAGVPSPPRKSGVSQKDELDSLPRRVDNRVVWSGDEKARPAKRKG